MSIKWDETRWKRKRHSGMPLTLWWFWWSSCSAITVAMFSDNRRHFWSSYFIACKATAMHGLCYRSYALTHSTQPYKKELLVDPFLNSNRQPESLNVYFCMGAKNTVQLAMSIRPGFVQLAWTLLDPLEGAIFAKRNPSKMFKLCPLLRSAG